MLVGSWYVIKSQDFFLKPKNCILCLHYYTFSLFCPGIALFIHGVNQVIFFFMRFSVILEPKLKKKLLIHSHSAPTYLLLPLGKWGSKWGNFHLVMGCA